MQNLRWSITDLTKLIQTPADQEYHVKVQVMVFEVSKGIDIFNMNELQRYQSEYNQFVQLEGDILEGMAVTSGHTPTIYGYYLWAKSYDTIHFINLRADFKTRLTVEHKNPRTNITGLDYWDPNTGVYKFIQTRQFFYDAADDSAYELAMQKFVFGLTQIEPPRPRFANETREYQIFINSRTVANANNSTIKWPSPYNRFAYYKQLFEGDKSKFERLKLEFVTGQSVSNKPFPDVIDDPLYDRWVFSIIIAKYDMDENKRSILDKTFKPRFDIEYVEWNNFVANKTAPNLNNRYAFYKHLQMTDPVAFENYRVSHEERAKELSMVANMCPGETILSGAVFQGAQYLMGVKPSFASSSIYALTHTIKQIILQDGIPNNALQASDESIIISAKQTAQNILESSALQWALFSGVEYYINGQQDIPFAQLSGKLFKTFISTLSGQSVLELRQLILDIQARQPKIKEKNPKANNQLEMVIGTLLFGNPEAPMPDWMKEPLEQTGGVVSWIIDNIQVIGIVAGSILILALVGIIYSSFKSTAPQIIIEKK